MTEEIKKETGLARIIGDPIFWTTMGDVAGVLIASVLVGYVIWHSQIPKPVKSLTPPPNYSIESSQIFDYPKSFQPEPINPEYSPKRQQI